MLLSTVVPVQADIRLAFTPDGSPTNFQVNVGQTIPVPVYVVQTNMAPMTTVMSDFGLGSGGVRLDFTNSISGGAELLTAVANPGWESNASGFPSISQTPAGGFGATSAGTTTTNLLFPPPMPAPQSILVGTFTFRGDLLDNVVTLSTTNPHPPTFSEFVAGLTPPNIFVLEQQPYGNIFWAGGIPPPNGTNIHYTSTITVVPEPALILGVCTPVVAVLAWRRRRGSRV
jgi:hypothetical protein